MSTMAAGLAEDDARHADIQAVLETVADPEIPALNVVDLGIVRGIEHDAEGWRVVITPTYSGCPATRVIEQDLRQALDAAGHRDCALELRLSPPWTTDWITAAGRRKLQEAGIAPPVGSADKSVLAARPPVPCPRCASTDTERLSEFGSTPCKAHYRCRACLEPFDYFKCL